MILKGWLILLQVPPLILLLVVLAVASLVTLNLRVGDWTGTIQDHVLAEERNHIVALAENVALFTQRRFARMTSDTIVVQNYAQLIVNQTLVVSSPYQSYHIDPSVDTSAPSSLRLGSSWFRLGNSNVADQPFLDNSSAMDNVWRTLPTSLYKASGIALETDGFFRAFPFSRSTTLSTREIFCFKNTSQVTGFDPRCREWYHGATLVKPSVYFSAPYIDALDSSGDSLIISSSAVITNPLDPSNIFGVVFNDISFGDLEDFYRRNTILENGFPFLLDDVTAQLLYYPQISRASPQYFRHLHFGSDTSSESIAFSNVFNQSAAEAKTTFQTVSFTYTKDGAQWQASISSVNGTTYLVGVVVPESDIRKPVDDVIARARAALVGALVAIIIIIAIMVVLSVIMNSVFATSIDKVIYELLGITERFADGDFGDDDYWDSAKILEISNIQDSFHNLALAVQFSNPEYFKDDVQKALRTSLGVEKMLVQCDNKRGLGKVQNNIALHCRTLDPGREFNDTTVIPYLQKSIESGNAILKEFSNSEPLGGSPHEERQFSVVEIQDQEARDLQIAVNSRRLNLLCAQEIAGHEAFDELIGKARKLHDEAGLVAACLRHAEILEASGNTEVALKRRTQAVQEAVMLLTGVLKNKPKEERKAACDAVFDAAYQLSLIREGEELDDKKTTMMYQHLNLALLSSALLEDAGFAPHRDARRAMRLLAHILNRRGEDTTAMIEELGLELNVEEDLAPVPLSGPAMTSENLLSAAPTTVGISAEAMKQRLEVNNGRHIEATAKTGYQFSLAWDSPVDLDLILDTPKGRVYYGERSLAGATLDVDRIPNSRTWDVDPVENIVCDNAVPGHYSCIVKYFSGHSYFNNAPAEYSIQCRVGDRFAKILTRTSYVDPQEETVCKFAVGEDGEVDPSSIRVAPPVRPPPPAVLEDAAQQARLREPSNSLDSSRLPSLRSYMATRFGIAYFLFTLLVFLVCLIVSLTTTARVKNDLRDALQDQVQRQATSLMKGAAATFTEDLTTASESGTKMIAQATADMFRASPAYSVSPTTSYYDLGGTSTADFKQPLEYLHGFSSSLQASSLYVPGELGDASALTASINSTADKTSTLDAFLVSMYGEKKDRYFNFAAGFEENALFRRMPAIDTNTFDPTRSFNPTTRSWYTSARSSGGTSIFTEPYRDFNTQRWMISVSSSAVQDTGTSAGASVADILLVTLVQSIRNLRVLGTGKITLVDHEEGSTSSPTVVADQEWLMSDNDGTIFALDTLRNPAVTPGMQSFIIDTPVVAEASFTRSETFPSSYTDSITGATTNEDVMLIPTRVSGFGDRYYFIAFLKESEVFAPFEPLLSDIRSVNTLLAVVLILVWIFSLLVSALTIFLASRMVAKPIIIIEANVQRMVENVGSPDLTQGCEDINSAPYDSASVLAENFNRMVRTMRESATAQAGSPLVKGDRANFAPYLKFVNRKEGLPDAAAGLDRLTSGEQ